MRTVAEKMGIKEGCRAILINAPKDAIEYLDRTDIVLAKSLAGEFDLIHLFAKTQAEQHKHFPALKAHLKLDGMLWVSWPKNKQLGTDLTLPTVIRIGYSFGLVESTCLSINSVWSGLKFTHPKKGKVYKNSHAKLKSRTTNRSIHSSTPVSLIGIQHNMFRELHGVMRSNGMCTALPKQFGDLAHALLEFTDHCPRRCVI